MVTVLAMDKGQSRIARTARGAKHGATLFALAHSVGLKNKHGFCRIRHMKGDYSWKLSVLLAGCVFVLLISVFSAWKVMLAKSEGIQEEAGGLQVVATVYPLYVMLLNITEGTSATPSLLTSPSAGCLHEHQLTTGDMKRLEAADLVVASGEGMEGFLDNVLTMKAGAVVVASEGWPELVAGNAHIWLSTDGAAWQTRRIAEALAAVDSANAPLYMSNCDEYTARLEALAERMRRELAPFGGRKVVLFHEAFVYLAHQAGLEVAVTLSEEELSSPSAKRISEVAGLIGEARGRGEPIVCFADTASSAAVRAVEQETEAKVWQLDTCTTGELQATSYTRAMDENIATLVRALAGGK